MENVKLNCLDQVTHLGSSKFGMISSSRLVTELSRHGLELDKVVEMKIRKRKEERQGFQKHRMLFNTGIETKNGKLQLLVTNSHEGSRALKFQLGFYRFVCSNGLVVGSTIVSPMSIRHTLDNVVKLNDTISMVMNQSTKVFESIEALQAKQWNQEQIVNFTDKALELRGYVKTKHGILTPDFQAKRTEDLSTDAFTIFNVVQENLVRTGFKAYDSKGVGHSIRAIKSLDEQNRINSQLWDLASAS